MRKRLWQRLSLSLLLLEALPPLRLRWLLVVGLGGGGLLLLLVVGAGGRVCGLSAQPPRGRRDHGRRRRLRVGLGVSSL